MKTPPCRWLVKLKERKEERKMPRGVWPFVMLSYLVTPPFLVPSKILQLILYHPIQPRRPRCSSGIFKRVYVGHAVYRWTAVNQRLVYVTSPRLFTSQLSLSTQSQTGIHSPDSAGGKCHACKKKEKKKKSKHEKPTTKGETRWERMQQEC